jgi:hypothetical protein
MSETSRSHSVNAFVRILRRLFLSIEETPTTRIENSDDSLLKDTLEHAREGYQNAQEVIKFLDTKTAVVTGLSTLLGGFLLVVLKWSVELDGGRSPSLGQVTSAYPCIAAWLYLFVLVSLLAAIVCLCSAVWSVIARARPTKLENEFTVLFPWYRQRDAADACRVFERKLSGMTKVEILKEYEDQLRIVGMILGRKLKHIRISCIALVAQILSLTLALILLSVMYIMHWPLGGQH